MDKRKMSILPVVTAAGYSRTYDWLWIGIANDLVREREDEGN